MILTLLHVYISRYLPKQVLEVLSIFVANSRLQEVLILLQWVPGQRGRGGGRNRTDTAAAAREPQHTARGD